MAYVVQFKQKYAVGAAYEEIHDVSGTEYTVVGLNAHTVYEFRVTAVNPIGRSMPSSPVDVTTGELGRYTRLQTVRAPDIIINPVHIV